LSLQQKKKKGTKKNASRRNGSGTKKKGQCAGKELCPEFTASYQKTKGRRNGEAGFGEEKGGRRERKKDEGVDFFTRGLTPSKKRTGGTRRGV